MQKRFLHHRKRYLRWNFEKQLPGFSEFYMKLKSMLKHVNSEELQFQLGFRLEEFEKELKLGFTKF